MRESYGAVYARLYNGHWWWRAREAIVLRTIRKAGLTPGEHREILDVGCGDGLSFPALSAFGRVRGIEVDERLLDPSGPYRDRIFTAPLGDSRYDGPSWRFDLITALDVLEHIDNDRAAAEAMVRMLRPGGLLVVTVPAFETLWDEHDEINHHYRRYTIGRLRRVLKGIGLESIRLRYVFRGLFAPKLAVRLVNLGRRRKVAQHGIPSPRVNAVMQRLCELEDRVLAPLPVPFGTSVLAVARRAIGEVQ
ncbi:class I SAM-dependent DNA methyltransferase [Tautonia rosea]|uniref:class I SAM-dependent DNA methyltransferase n=1 Tax=Tautonia rosea TaxID=2728037 RepID=UPI001472B2A6|nr:class I SAM-dependent methyltransferase [Tautonia rosea]